MPRRIRSLIVSTAAIVAVGLSTSKIVAGSGESNYSLFYNIIVGVAQLSGFDASTLPSNPTDAYRRAVCAYVWGYPLEETWRHQILFTATSANVGETFYADEIVTSLIVSPNLNVLYTSTWLDLSDSSTGWVVTVPNTTSGSSPSGLYNITQLLDAYTNVVQSVGTRNWSTGELNNEGGDWLMVGPGYDLDQPLPNGIAGRIASPTPQAWLLTRIVVDSYATSTADGGPTPYSIAAGGSCSPYSLPNVVPLNQQFIVQPLENFESGEPYVPPPFRPDREIAKANQHPMTGLPFLEYVGDSVAFNGVPADQQPMFENFAAIGLTSTGFSADRLPPATILEIELAIEAAAQMIDAIGSGAPLNTSCTNWVVNTSLGEYSADYVGWITAATAADIGFGANVAADAVYPRTTRDAAGNALDGSAGAYEMTFRAGDLPPVEAFWSLTVYDGDAAVVPNTGNTYYGDDLYALSSMQMSVVLGDEYPTSGITIRLQSDPPTDPDEMPFWLPVPDGPFNLILRLYIPSDADSPSSILAPPTASNYFLVPAVRPASDDCSSADFDGDGVVGGPDLATLLSAWGTDTSCESLQEDLNGDGTVDGIDLTIFLSSWGTCP